MAETEYDMLMLNTSLLIVILQTTPSAGQPKAAPCAGQEFRQFDFWVGDWTVRTPKGTVAGTNRIEVVEGGCGLQENWTGTGNTGRSINAFSPQDRTWHQFWLGSGGLVMHLIGGLRGGSMVLDGQTTGNGQVTRQRITWTPIPDGRVRQLWEQSTDDGKTWSVAFDGMYSKK